MLGNSNKGKWGMLKKPCLLCKNKWEGTFGGGRCCCRGHQRGERLVIFRFVERKGQEGEEDE